MKFIDYKIYSGKENMQIDEDLLLTSIKNKSKDAVFRLYGWNPACISLGRNQKDDFIDYDFLKDKNIDVVKRLTGGRALLHADEITYSFICPCHYLKNGENIMESYKEISQILIDKLKLLGINLTLGCGKSIHTKFDYCMLISTGADLCFDNKKLIGSAQCRKEGYILQHGSILYTYDKKILEEIFKEEINTNSIISIKEINSNITKEDIIAAFSTLKADY